MVVSELPTRETLVELLSSRHGREQAALLGLRLQLGRTGVGPADARLAEDDRELCPRSDGYGGEWFLRSTCAPTYGGSGGAVPAVHCFLCAHHCRIAPGETGLCGVRENKDGVLYTLVYGRPVSTAVDPIEKKPLFHFLPGSRSLSLATVGCNFTCAFCQNSDISQMPRDHGQGGGRPADPAAGGRGGAGRGLRQHLLHLHRADHLLRVRPGLRAAGFGRRASRTSSSPTAT